MKLIGTGDGYRLLCNKSLYVADQFGEWDGSSTADTGVHCGHHFGNPTGNHRQPFSDCGKGSGRLQIYYTGHHGNISFSSGMAPKYKILVKFIKFNIK